MLCAWHRFLTIGRFRWVMVVSAGRRRQGILLALLLTAAFLMFMGAGAAQAESPSTGSTLKKAKQVKSIALDARELLFGKKGAKLTLKATVSPKGADASTLKFASSDTSVATVTSKGVVKAKGWGKCNIVVSVGRIKAKCKVVVANKWVALTFDDGPGPKTSVLLDAMEKRGIRATFFVVGANAVNSSRAPLLKRMAELGCEVGNHTYNHNGSSGALMNELAKTDKAVKKAMGKTPVLMRPPGGAINSVTRRCGRPIILWSVDPQDWRYRNSTTVYNRVMNNTKSGSIVLLHDIHSTTITAAAWIMDALAKKGYAFVTVSELLGSPKANTVYTKGSSTVRTMKIPPLEL